MVSGEARDAFFMRKALCLAERGRGRTSPNPMVGALVVDSGGVIVGRGSHELAGEPHAEVLGLREAGTRAGGATLYCTLEPCRHVGRTGPCAPLVVAAGISRVVMATEDPNPEAGGGGAFLRDAGIQVTTGILAEEARRLNAPFFSIVLRRRPFVTMKVAVSLDGRIAARPGVRTALTGPPAHRAVHRERAELDAIAVGSGTVLADDPELTARVAFRARPLTRVIYDRRLRTLPSARLFSTLEAGPVIIVTTGEHVSAAQERAAALRSAGAEIWLVNGAATLERSLESLAARGISSMVVEGGAWLHRAFWDAGLVDRVQMYVAGCMLGDRGVAWVPGPIISSARVARRSARPIGEDVLLEAYVHGAD